LTLLQAAVTGLCLAVATLTVVWALSVRLRDASIVDICWGPGFVLLAWSYCIMFGAFAPRPLLLAALVSVWGVRLGVHIHRRHGGRGEDPRYRAMREARGHSFWWRSLFLVFWLQGALLWFVALPILVTAAGAGPDRVTVTDIIGVLLFVAGFAFEAIGDLQLARFKADRSNRGRVMDAGLWRYTRHPNYFGDAVLWWGLYVLAIAAPHGWLTALSPVLMTVLLMRVSGVTLLEQSMKDRPGYREYMMHTPAFVPWFPRDGSASPAGRQAPPGAPASRAPGA
jgi:steroid 5-alpha reductase family enzyme